MPVISPLLGVWRAVAAPPPLPLEVEADLVAPLYTRITSLMAAHISVICLSLIAVLRIGGNWPTLLMLASLAVLLARAWVIVMFRRAPVATPQHILRWRLPYQAIGITWAAVSSMLCTACFAIAGDEFTRVVGIAVALGITAGLASRSAGTPRFAAAQLGIWLLPVMVVAPLLGPWYWVFSLMAMSYLAAMCSIVRQNYTDLVARIGAEHRNTALATMLDAAVSNMTQGLLMFAPSGALRLASRRFCELFGLSEQALPHGLGEPAFAALCASVGAPHELGHAPVDAMPGDTIRLVLDLADGRALATAQQILADGGRVVTVEDITQTRLAQRALADRAAGLGAMFDNAGAGIIEYDIASKRIVRVNRVYCAMMGRSEADLLAETDAARLTHPDDRGEHIARTAAIALTGHPYDSEKRYLRADGGVLWARISASITATHEDGRPARLLAIVQDITERRATEAALHASEEMLRLSLEVARIGVYRRDYSTGLLHCGRETRTMHGFEDGDAPVPDAVWVAMLLPDDRAALVAGMRAAFAEHHPTAAFEYRYHHPLEGIRHIETRSRIEYDETGQPVGSVGVAIDVTERRAAEARISHLAHHDPLTDLPNRSLFRIRLDEALARARRGQAFAVLCLDLDHFKYVNDTLGHPIGDALLQAVTRRLRIAVRPTDTVARLGGDEFAIIQSDRARAADTTSLAARVIAAIAAPFDIEGHRIVIGTSIGISTAPDDALDADELLRNADMALYSAKGEERGRYRFFEPEMDMRMQARRALELDLRHALEDDAFELYYQPVIGIADSAVLGMEALLRWRHPGRGVVTPDRFIPLAEAIGLIVPIGDWVLRRACSDAMCWPGKLRVGVNVSAVQFASRTLVDSVAAALLASGLEPWRLELEITESAMLNDTEANLETLHRLRALGVRVAMDDFGTGYSSLSYLLRFPFDKVKIDRAFVTNLGRSRESAAIVGAVIGLCASLEMTTTAEGVETAGQLKALARIGCTEAQGFYFSPARPAAEIPGIIRSLSRNATALIEAAE